MTDYIEDRTQEQRILDLLTQRGERGVEVWEFMLPRPQGGCGIAQYNARIFGLRKKGYLIINQPKGHFVLKNPDGQQVIFNQL